MTIPAFDGVGNLPVGNLFAQGQQGLITVTLEQVYQRFVLDFPSSSTRQQIWDGWMSHRMQLAATGVHFSTLVDGSFISSKLDPGDIDICLLLDSSEVEGLPPEVQDVLGPLISPAHCKANYLCDAYPLFVFPFAASEFSVTVTSLSYWTRVFGIDRNGHSKSLLFVIGESTQ
jgi:hypothetical protein